MKLSLRIRFLIANMVCITALAGQTTVPPVMPERVTLRLLALEGRVSDLVVQGPGGKTPLDIRSTRFTRDVVAMVSEGRVFLLGKTTPDSIPTNTAPAAPQPAASFAVTPGVSRYVVVLVAAAPGRFHLLAQPDDANILAEDHVRVLNFTSQSVAIQLDTNQAVIPSGDSAVLPCLPDKNNAVRLKLANLAAPDQWRIVASTRISISRTHRQFLLITAANPGRASAGTSVVAEGGPLQTRIIFDPLIPTP